MPVYKKIGEFLEFFNISKEDFTLFEWKPERSFRRFDLDLNIVKQNPIKDIFFHRDKGNMKIVYIRKGDLIYTVGSSPEVQFQLLEALIEHIDSEFNETYNLEVIMSYGDFTPTIFNGFMEIVDGIIKNFANLDLVRRIQVECRVCNTVLPLFVKKSFIENAESYPVPIVYKHKGHAILCFIDQNFQHRGVELVNITG
ncbi:hypothetical protein LCGC14_0707020 [marine sediment metagenome]|uniref:Uncharacterized protein n=1 Tax=marine sediment metagenome TaxID=412755 RepID=A0A0F9QKS8_9ZZZZ|nr:MAG: hypothetical protein Lokiarch_11080 [Candidatus Lokiarchaeum sp. GC14_75]